MQSVPSGFYPRKRYRRRNDESKDHYKKWGQRKLLLTEIRFLCDCIDLTEDTVPITCVYPGAGPGNHIPMLADMFPMISFELWDPVCFDSNCFHHPRITVNGGCSAHRSRSRHRSQSTSCCYFSDEMARSYAQRVGEGERIVLISDIRTGDPKHQSARDVEYYVIRDQEMQRKWIEIIRPFRSLLKFRCPYPDRFEVDSPLKYRYCDGIVYLQPYLGPTSSETRLVVMDGDDGALPIAMREYNVYPYEEKLFWWNTVARQCLVKNGYYCPEIGFIHSLDCWMEGVILEKYCTKTFALKKEKHLVLQWLVPLMVHHITKRLSPSGNTTLLTRFQSKDHLKRLIDHTEQCTESATELKAKCMRHLTF